MLKVKSILDYVPRKRELASQLGRVLDSCAARARERNACRQEELKLTLYLR